MSDQIKYICYDNSCYLAEIDHSLKNKTFVNDRFHLKNHKRKKCQTIHNCDTYSDLQGLNSEICEQKFYKISKLKHQVKHMNKYRNKFFFLEILNLLNKR